MRSVVPAVRDYKEYRPYLRRDFLYSCAYCTMSEAEAHGIRFCIDHYEPKSVRPDLSTQYNNLMYACDRCNVLKGDRVPSDSARGDGYRFFRPDSDQYEDHFDLNGLRVTGKSRPGEFTIEALDLNRSALRTIRRLRARLAECERLAVAGVHALKHFQLDQLQPFVRGQAVRLIRDAEVMADEIRNQIDGILAEFARSSLLDEDIEYKERLAQRKSRLKKWNGLSPGEWRSEDGQ